VVEEEATSTALAGILDPQLSLFFAVTTAVYRMKFACRAVTSRFGSHLSKANLNVQRLWCRGQQVCRS
jgi:hypothetical protein